MAKKTSRKGNGKKSTAAHAPTKTQRKAARKALAKAESALRAAEKRISAIGGKKLPAGAGGGGGGKFSYYAGGADYAKNLEAARRSKEAVAALNAGAARIMAARAPAEIKNELMQYSKDISAMALYKQAKKAGRRGGKKRSSQPAARASAPKVSKKRASKKTASKKRASKKADNRQVTAAQVMKMAETGKLKRWLCEAPKRTGCGKRAKVVSGKGSFARLRSPRQLAA